VNGAMSQYKGLSFVLQPKKAGNITIKPATVTADGQQLRSNVIQITVHNQPSVSGNAPASGGFNPLPDPNWPNARPQVEMDEVVKPGEKVEDKIRRNFFLKVEVSKADCYVGEPIVATYKLYARLRSDSRVTRHPSLNGFSVYDMIDPNDDQVTVEKVNGKNYNVHITRKTQLIPLQSGDITLDPVELDNNIYLIRAEANSSRNSDKGLSSLLDRIFEPEVSGTPFSQHIILESKPFIVHVKPLPETGKPLEYNGAVGKYSIQASANTREVDTGDAAILSVVIKGNGNLPVVNAPTVNWPTNMESYDVSSKENIDKSVAPLGGSKTFNYSFICSQPGKYTLPPVAFSYFDPASKSYKRIETEPIPIQINKATLKKTKPAPVQREQTTNTDWFRYLLWSFAFLLLAVCTIFIMRQSKKAAALENEKKQQLAALEKIKNAPPPPDPLKESRELLQAGDFNRFYGSVNRAVWKSVSDKLQLPASELNKLNIAGSLRDKGWSDEEIIQLKNVLNECEMKLYTPEYSTSDMQRIFSSAEQIIEKLKA
jgi:hypothetical protein